jgi:hypothetical protein
MSVNPIDGKPRKRGPKPGQAKGNAGIGRQKGVPNKVTQAAREAIARFVDGNADKLQEWLDEIAEVQGAHVAFKCFMDVVEYHVPKLARTELTGKDGGPIETRPLMIVPDDGND